MLHPKTILLIEDDSDYEQLVCELLARAPEKFAVQSAASLGAGIALLEKSRPELILVDLNLPDSTGYDTFLRLRQRAGEIPIIVLTGLDDDQTAVRAVKDGAQDYLVKSLIQPTRLARCVSIALSRHDRQTLAAEPTAMPASVLAFLGSKGGVGTSTTAINLAAALAQNGFDTLAIELETGRSATLSLYLDAQPQFGLDTMCERAPGEVTGQELQRCTREVVPGLRLLCAVDRAGNGTQISPEHLESIIALARRSYRFIVLDLPARMDEGTLRLLELCDSIVVVVDRETASLRCAASLLARLKSSSSQKIASNLGVVLVDRTALEAPLPLPEIKAKLGMNPLAVIPCSVAGVSFSQSACTPLIELCPNDPFSLAHLELAERLLTSVHADLRDLAHAVQPILSSKRRQAVIPEITYG